MSITGKQISERFFDKVERNGSCWNWRGYLRPDGYGHFTMHTNRKVYAHRFSYLFHVGGIPGDMEIHHTCGNRGCVNPGHLETVTRNQHRIIDGPNRVKTHCKRGHELTPGNRNRDGKCRVCINEKWMDAYRSGKYHYEIRS
jgi:hypothetical protein